MAEAIIATGAVARKIGEPIGLERVVVPAPGPGEARVRILASGVCHTDLSAKNGVFGPDVVPLLLGHEGAAVVEDVGVGVSNVRAGDYVILAWRAPCGGCRFCEAGKPHLCAASLNATQKMTAERDGIELNPVLGLGTFSTHTLVHAGQCVPVREGLPSAQMSLIGCGVMTGVGAALYTGKVEPGSSVAVFGCGGVGDSIIMGSVLAGATAIIAVDVDPKKLEWARGFGATHLVNAMEVDPVEKIKEITGGHGVNFSFEAVGRAETTMQALLARDLAGTCVVVGVAGPGSTIEQVPLGKLFDLGGTIRFSWYGDCLPTRDFPMLASWYEQGRLDLDDVVTKKIALDDVEDAFHAMERGETLRSVIMFDEAEA
ncbi:MAG TPA: zinc-binding dehydrogenase [Thermomicrobiales bacterium]|nr:zinc-binding dehydrogenase [Thermomicrobiales bacterium]